IHVKSISGRKLYDVIFKRKAADGNGFDLIAVARQAELRVDLAHKRINVHMQKCQVLHGNDAEAMIDSRIWPVDLPDDFLGSKVKVRAMDMTWAELSEYDENARRDREKLKLQQAMLDAAEANGAKPDLQQRQSITVELEHRDHIINMLQADWQMVPALSLGCLCFALVGCPVGIWFSKSDYLSAFITCFLPIVVLYYPAMLCLFNMARAGRVSPWLSVYDADAFTLILGGILFHRLA